MLVAIRDGDHHKVEELLDQRADENARTEIGDTALMQAALNADVAMMELLLRRGADPMMRGAGGVPILLRALHDSLKVRLLLRLGIPVDDQAMVVTATIPGSRPTLELLHRRGGRINANVGGFTPLMAAAFAGDRGAVSYLVDEGADVKARTGEGFTALNGAAVSGDATIVQLLLDHGADANARYDPPGTNGDFQTPIIAAALQGHAGCLKPLLEHGAEVNVQGGPFDRTALLGAATTGQEESIRLLMAHGAHVNAEDWEGDTPLAWARRRGQTPIVKLLRQAGGKEPPPEKSREPRRLHSRIKADSVRIAVAAALPLLQQSGLKLTETKGCITCHQTSLVAMTVGLVRKHGLPVNEDLAARARAQVNGMLASKLPALLLGADLDPTLAPYTLVGMAAEAQEPSPLTDALVHYLVLRQKTDGHWTAEAYRPPEDGSDFLSTALAVRALQAYAPRGRSQAILGRLDRARSWLGQAHPAETVDQVFQLLGLHWTDAGSEPIRQAADALLQAQRADGGWAQLPTLPSDAYATGQVLCALQETGTLSVEEPAYRRGVEYLLQAQLADGTWFVPTRCFPVLEFTTSGFPHGRSQFISAAATCWATMALVRTLAPGSGPEASLTGRPLDQDRAPAANDSAPRRASPPG
jgi:ankyrin repeat protein